MRRQCLFNSFCRPKLLSSEPVSAHTSMRDLARRDSGGKIVLTTCSDRNHLPENMLDGQESTFWITTGMYPQEFVLAVAGVANVSKITTLCRNGEAGISETCR